MNIERLKALRDLEQSKQIDMERYMNACGTAGCHAGWTLVLAGVHRTEVWSTCLTWDRSKEYLELTEDESRFLFQAHTYFKDRRNGNHCTEQEARLRLDFMIDHGRMPDLTGAEWK